MENLWLDDEVPSQKKIKWDHVKVDKHRENYLGHSIKAPVGRWQKGKDLFWYARDKKSDGSAEAMKEEIRRIKEEEEQAMREALGLAPKRASRPQGNRLDKHEYAELIKRGSTAEDMEGGHAEAALVQGLGLYKGPPKQGESSSLPDRMKAITRDKFDELPPATRDNEIYEEEDGKRKRPREGKDEGQRREEMKEDKRREERKEDKRHKHEKKWSHDSDDKRKHSHRDKGKRKRHDSDSE